MLLTYAADGETVGLIVVALWVDVATAEVQVPSVHRRGSTYRPEVAVRALIHRRARCPINKSSIRKREWEICVMYYKADDKIRILRRLSRLN